MKKGKIPDAVREYMRELGRKRQASMSEAERKAFARKGVEARKKPKK